MSHRDSRASHASVDNNTLSTVVTDVYAILSDVETQKVSDFPPLYWRLPRQFEYRHGFSRLPHSRRQLPVIDAEPSPMLPLQDLNCVKRIRKILGDTDQIVINRENEVKEVVRGT
jgi:hypothetical protein